MVTSVGVDISSESFAVCVIDSGSHRNQFDNTESGFTACHSWMQKQGIVASEALAVLEATGVYWEALALYLHQQGYRVSVVNPAQVKYFARSILQRGKSDPQDAELLARFAASMNPRVWEPPSAISEELQTLMRQRDAYVAMLTQERNRLHALKRSAHQSKRAITISEQTIRFLQQQVKELDESFKDTISHDARWQKLLSLLQTVPGIGLVTAAVLLTETGALSAFHSARQLTAYAGIAPAPYSSGKTVLRQPHISKIGNPRLRRAFYMAALSSIRFNPAIRSFYNRLSAKGKPKKVVIVAIARKLLVWSFAICKSQEPFNPQYALA